MPGNRERDGACCLSSARTRERWLLPFFSKDAREVGAAFLLKGCERGGCSKDAQEKVAVKNLILSGMLFLGRTPCVRTSSKFGHLSSGLQAFYFRTPLRLTWQRIIMSTFDLLSDVTFDSLSNNSTSTFDINDGHDRTNLFSKLPLVSMADNGGENIGGGNEIRSGGSGASDSSSSSSSSSSSGIQPPRASVFVRVRPLIQPELDNAVARLPGMAVCSSDPDADPSSVVALETESGQRISGYAGVLGPEASNEDVFLRCFSSRLATVASGGTASFFASGYTGGGKSHTVLGGEGEL
jgi:hypothetical protein